MDMSVNPGRLPVYNLQTEMKNKARTDQVQGVCTLNVLPESHHYLLTVKIKSINSSKTEQHIRPVWLSQDYNSHKQLDCELDIGPGCNVLTI